MKTRRATKAKAPKQPTEEVARPLRTRAVYRNLQLTDDGVWAWFRLGAVAWDYKSSGDQASVLQGHSMRWADLSGLEVQMRRLSHPVDHEGWGRRLFRATPAPIETPEDAPTFLDLIHGAERRIASLGLTTPITYIGVRITEQTPTEDHHLRCIHNGCTKDAKHEKLHQELVRVTSTVGKSGWRGKPISSRVWGWLTQESTALGCPVDVQALAGDPDVWTDDDVTAFTNSTHVSAAPGDMTVTVRAIREGHEHVRHVAVLTAGRMEDQDDEHPSFIPWLTASDNMPFPVDWSARFRILPPQEALTDAERAHRRAKSIRSGYVDDHGEKPPPRYDRGILDAERIVDEIHEGTREVRPRLAGVLRAAVSGATPAEAIENSRTLTAFYAENCRIALHHLYGQYAQTREFIPGESYSKIGYQRRMPTYYAATAAPNAGVQLGDGEGMYLGASGHRAVFFDPTWGPRHNKSGLVVLPGNLGSGKSTLLGAFAEFMVRSGHQTVIFDPSGPLAVLTKMPAFRDVAQVVELAGADPGTLNPFWLLPDPRREDHGTDKEFEQEFREVTAERMDLMIDAANMLLEEEMPGARKAIARAVSQVGGAYGTNPWRVVRALEQGSEVAQDVAQQLRDASRMKGASLIFPEDQDAETVRARGLGDALFTVITMRGLATPRTSDARRWSRAERMSVPVQHLAARYALRAMTANKRPKLIAVDETKLATGGDSAFRGAVMRGTRDSRKFNTCFVLLGQNPSDMLTLDEEGEFENLIGAAFVGRLKGKKSAAAGLQVLGAPTDHGYEEALLQQSAENDTPGRFVFRDWNGNVGTLDVDLWWRPDLLAALDTTPPSADDSAEAPHWRDDLVVA